MHCSSSLYLFFFFFNHTATTEIYTLSLHDALPISLEGMRSFRRLMTTSLGHSSPTPAPRDRKSTRLNSSHQIISYAVFCLKKKKNIISSSSKGKHKDRTSSSIFINVTILRY